MISQSPRHMYLFRKKASFYGEELLASCPTPSWRTTSCWLFTTAYSIYVQLPPILDTVPQPDNVPCCGDGNPLIMEINI